MEDSTITLGNLRKFVECPICEDLPRDGMMFQCSNSHMICSSCLGKLSKRVCPTGRCRYQKPAMRVRPIEDIIRESNFVYSCANAGSGCAFEGPKKTMDDHEKICPFKKFKCFISSCSRPMSIRDFSKHMEEAHGVKVAGCTGENNAFTKSFSIPARALERGRYFTYGLRHVEGTGTFVPVLFLQDGIFHIWVYYVGGGDAAERLKVEIKLSGAGTGHCWEGRPHAIGTPREAILADQDHIRASWQILRAFTTLAEDGTRHLRANVKVEGTGSFRRALGSYLPSIGFLKNLFK